MFSHIITHRYCVRFFLTGCFVAVVCMQVAEHYKKIIFLCLSLSFLPTPRLSLSLSLSLCLSLPLSFIPAHFFQWDQVFGDCVKSGWKGISDRVAFFPSSPSYIAPDIMSFFSRIGKIKAYVSGPCSLKSGFLRSKFALHGQT